MKNTVSSDMKHFPFFYTKQANTQRNLFFFVSLFTSNYYLFSVFFFFLKNKESKKYFLVSFYIVSSGWLEFGLMH